MSLNHYFSNTLPVGILLVCLSGCGGSDDPAPEVVQETPEPILLPTIEENVVITDLDTNSLVQYAELDTLQLDFVYEVRSLDEDDIAENGIDLSFHLVSETPMDDGTHDSHFLGMTWLEAPEVGSNIASATFIVPNVQKGGDYRIYTVVDASELETQRDETLNTSVEAYFDALLSSDAPYEVVSISNAANNFEIVNAAISSDVVVLDNVENDDLAGENRIDLSGYIDARYMGSDLSADQAELIIEVMINGVYEEVLHWDDANDQFVLGSDSPLLFEVDYEHGESIQDSIDESLPEESSEEEATEHVAFQIAFTDPQLATLTELYLLEQSNNDTELSQISLRLTINDPTGDSDEDLSNNVKLLSVPYFVFTPEAQTGDRFAARAQQEQYPSLTGSFGAGYGDPKKVKAGVAFGGGVKGNFPEKSASIEASGKVSITMFENEVDITSARAELTGYLENGKESEFYLGVDVLGYKVYENFEKKEEISISLPPLTFPKEQMLAEANFWIKFIPITVAAGISGSFGFQLTEIKYSNNSNEQRLSFKSNVAKVDVGAIARGGLGVPKFNAGVAVNLKAIENTLKLDGYADISKMLTDEQIGYGFKLHDQIDVIRGRIGVYAEGPWPKITPWFIDFTAKYLWIYETPGIYSTEFDILNHSGTFSL